MSREVRTLVDIVLVGGGWFMRIDCVMSVSLCELLYSRLE